MTTNPYKLPDFSHFPLDQFEALLKQRIKEHKETLETLLTQQHFSWENLLQPMEKKEESLQELWSLIEHLHSVADSSEIRKTYEKCQPILTEYQTSLSQNETLYKAIQYIADQPDFQKLSVAQQQIIRHHLRDFRLSGVSLPVEKKKQFQQLTLKLHELMTKFEMNALDSRSAWHYYCEDKKELAGIPEYILASAKQRAKDKNLPGWDFSLDFPVYYAIMTYSKNRPLREKFYRAYATIASELAENPSYDNSQVMREILSIRQQLAHLIDMKNYAEYSLASKMASKPETVLNFLQDLGKRARPQAQKELEELKHFAHEMDQLDDIQSWDVTYYSERMKEKLFQLSEEELRPYFPLQQVTNGLFHIVQQLFGIQLRILSTVDTWHPDVTCYEVINSKQETCGYFYMDLFARDNKRAGAWMSHYRNRHLENGLVQLPIAFLNCNFHKPAQTQPALLNHQEVETLFHEFGHTLHHLLTKINYSSAAGINGVEWDAVELPSQFLENWCWQKESLALFAKHYQTGEILPEKMLNSLLQAKNFQSALFLVRQLEFALFDFRLHIEYTHHSEDIQRIINEVRKEISVIQPPQFNRFQNSFGHIFAGGYAAGYYSYLWAEVLSCDAFGLFKEEGVLDPNTGRRFLENILEKGGSEDAMELFKKFRGREPSVDYLLRDKNIQ